MMQKRTLSESEIDRLLAEVEQDNFLSDETDFFGVRRVHLDLADDGEWVDVAMIRAVREMGAAL